MGILLSVIHNRRKVILYFNLFLFVLLSLFLRHENSNESVCSAKRIQQGIASEIIRFHVIANSDKEEDQALKIKVKDEIVAFMKARLEPTCNKEEAREVILNNISEIDKIARRVIIEEGYIYKTLVSLENVYFPTKIYGDMTFPPGEYEALKIQIGEAKGKNWWCVMFPPLCFVDATYNIVPQESKDTLKYLLEEEEYNAILMNKKTKVKVKFKLVDFIKQKIY